MAILTVSRWIGNKATVSRAKDSGRGYYGDRSTRVFDRVSTSLGDSDMQIPRYATQDGTYEWRAAISDSPHSIDSDRYQQYILVTDDPDRIVSSIREILPDWDDIWVVNGEVLSQYKALCATAAPVEGFHRHSLGLEDGKPQLLTGPEDRPTLGQVLDFVVNRPLDLSGASQRDPIQNRNWVIFLGRPQDLQAGIIAHLNVGDKMYLSLPGGIKIQDPMRALAESCTMPNILNPTGCLSCPHSADCLGYLADSTTKVASKYRIEYIANKLEKLDGIEYYSPIITHRLERSWETRDRKIVDGASSTSIYCLESIALDKPREVYEGRVAQYQKILEARRLWTDTASKCGGCALKQGCRNSIYKYFDRSLERSEFLRKACIGPVNDINSIEISPSKLLHSISLHISGVDLTQVIPDNSRGWSAYYSRGYSMAQLECIAEAIVPTKKELLSLSKSLSCLMENLELHENMCVVTRRLAMALVCPGTARSPSRISFANGYEAYLAAFGDEECYVLYTTWGNTQLSDGIHGWGPEQKCAPFGYVVRNKLQNRPVRFPRESLELYLAACVMGTLVPLNTFFYGYFGGSKLYYSGVTALRPMCTEIGVRGVDVLTDKEAKALEHIPKPARFRYYRRATGCQLRSSEPMKSIVEVALAFATHAHQGNLGILLGIKEAIDAGKTVNPVM